jgi:serine phosphatase RsbU (regulator of sigma subunit)
MTSNNEQGLIKIIVSDFIDFLKEFFNGNLFKNLKHDYNNLKEFFFDKYRRKRLEEANPISRFFIGLFWLLKMLLIKLSSFRRILVVTALVFLLSSVGGQNNQTKIVLGVLLILLVLMLELKDKLLARQELEAGRSIQKVLMPDENPKLAGWDIFLVSEPANEVGGDLVDFIPINNKKGGIAVGDVAGKGLPAALLMAKLQATLRALLPEAKSLSDLASQLNRIFYRDSLPERFASLCLLILEQYKGEISLVNAGHLPPLLIKGEKINEMSKGRTALGLTSATRYKEQQIYLDISDLLFIYSDGVCEARNERDQFYAEESLYNLLTSNRDLSAQEIGKLIIKTLHEFIGETPQFDDISFAVVKRTA